MSFPNARPADVSNGYEAVAGAFMSHRSGSPIGVGMVRRWTEEFLPAASVLDLGCGHGVPISQVLVDRGLTVYGIDASPSMIDRFRARVPGAVAECAAVESSVEMMHAPFGIRQRQPLKSEDQSFKQATAFSTTILAGPGD